MPGLGVRVFLILPSLSFNPHAFAGPQQYRHSAQLPAYFPGTGSRGKLDMLIRRWLLLICTAAHYSARDEQRFHPLPYSCMQSLPFLKIFNAVIHLGFSFFSGLQSLDYMLNFNAL